MKVAFSITTGNFLAQAKTVGDSFLEHHPTDKLVIVLVDKVEQIDKSFFPGLEINEVDALGIPRFTEMLNRYSLFELANSLRPFFAEFLPGHVPETNALLYLDSVQVSPVVTTPAKLK